MPLYSGKECQLLEGFGDKICKSIDEKLKSFLKDGGILHEEEILDSSSDETVREEIAAKPSNKGTNHQVPSAASDEDDTYLVEAEKQFATGKVLNHKPVNSIIKIGQKNKAIHDHDEETNAK
jgi:hypothetical protein